MRQIVPKSSIAVFEVCEHESIFAFKMPVEGSLRHPGEGHDLLGAGRADSLCVKEAVNHFQNSLPRSGCFACIHEIRLTDDQHVHLY